MAGWKLTPDPDRFHGLSLFFQSVGFLIHYFAFMLKRPPSPPNPPRLSPVALAGTASVPRFPGFVTNTTIFFPQAYVGGGGGGGDRMRENFSC